MRTLVCDGEGREFEQTFASQAALATAYPNGTYQVTFGGRTISVPFTGDVFPAAPIATLSAGTFSNGNLVVDTGAFAVEVPSNRAAPYQSHAGRNVVLGIRPDDIHDPSYAPPGIAVRPDGTTLVVHSRWSADEGLILRATGQAAGRHAVAEGARVGRAHVVRAPHLHGADPPGLVGFQRVAPHPGTDGPLVPHGTHRQVGRHRPVDRAVDVEVRHGGQHGALRFHVSERTPVADPEGQQLPRKRLRNRRTVGPLLHHRLQFRRGDVADPFRRTLPPPVLGDRVLGELV